MPVLNNAKRRIGMIYNLQSKDTNTGKRHKTRRTQVVSRFHSIQSINSLLNDFKTLDMIKTDTTNSTCGIMQFEINMGIRGAFSPVSTQIFKNYRTKPHYWVF